MAHCMARLRSRILLTGSMRYTSGVMVYGKACEADVKGCIDRGPRGIRTSSAVAVIDGKLEVAQIE